MYVRDNLNFWTYNKVNPKILLCQKYKNRVNPNLVVQVDVHSGRTKGRTKGRNPGKQINLTFPVSAGIL